MVANPEVILSSFADQCIYEVGCTQVLSGCNRTGVALGLLDGRGEKKALPLLGEPTVGWGDT